MYTYKPISKYGRETDKQTERQRETETERDRDRQTDRQRQRQTETDSQTETETGHYDIMHRNKDTWIPGYLDSKRTTQNIIIMI